MRLQAVPLSLAIHLSDPAADLMLLSLKPCKDI